MKSITYKTFDNSGIQKSYVQIDIIHLSKDIGFELSHVSSCINMCRQQNVQDLVLRFHPCTFDPGHYLDLNSLLSNNIFGSNVKELEISCVPKPRVPLPNISFGLIIKNLNLHGVKLPGGHSNDKLNLSFVVVQVLRIDLCDLIHLKILTLSTPLVKKLWFRSDIERKEEKRMWWSGSSIFQEEKAFDVKEKIYTSHVKTLRLATFLSTYSFPIDYLIE